MTPGATSPLQERELDDLGRFGLGLKTASWSQCKRVTVFTKKENSTHHLTWDLEHVGEVDQWELIEALNPVEIEILQGRLERHESGTAVLWTDLDRVISETGTEQEKEMHFYATMTELVIPHLSMVLVLGEIMGLKLKVRLTECKPWDPSCPNPCNTRGGWRKIQRRRDCDHTLYFTSFKQTDHSNGSEAEGSRVGMLIQDFRYRRERMIISGGYFDLDVKSNQALLCRMSGFDQ